uniref:dnaJ homolog subfamily C member 17-like n=1 Tax=Fragaria vesca subsp. vesca TaxID=101020 RepID=UPI0005C8D85E|nr:PREDICTED: dnaJ homolog subfamily C member 17-like [Fragaria vesca subsp. vesca]
MEKRRKTLTLDHYEVLGLPTGKEGTKLSEKQITKAYKRKALQLHPDKRPNDPNANAEFQKLYSSYELLMDPKARKRFDASVVTLGNKPSKPKRESPKPKRESPEPKRESPKPEDESPSEPNRDVDDDECRESDLFVFGYFVCLFAPLVFPATGSRIFIVTMLVCFFTGLALATRRQKSEYQVLCEWAIQLGQFFKSQYYKLIPSRAAADNQESQGDSHEDIEDWVMV